MTGLPPPAPVPERHGLLDAAGLAALVEAGQPVVLRGLAADWPFVAAGRAGPDATVAYLKRMGAARPVTAIIAAPEEGGRFFYNAGLTGMNFAKGQGRLDLFLDDLLRAADMDGPPAMAVQSEVVPELLPALAAENRLALLAHVPPRIWIGNRIRVAPHFDVKENLAVCAAGRRRFTLFPPGQIGNLYPGPLELTPAGTPVSMVDMAQPDLAAYPRFAEAWRHALQATLEPGDALFIPYCWWHGVESLAPVSVLVNYWWSEGVPEGAGSAYDAMLHALLAIRPLPPRQRAVWRQWFDHYVFEQGGDPVAHLPVHAQGMLGRGNAGLFQRMRQILRQALG